jgi:hypothetical protein
MSRETRRQVREIGADFQVRQELAQLRILLRASGELCLQPGKRVGGQSQFDCPNLADELAHPSGERMGVVGTMRGHVTLSLAGCLQAIGGQ